MADRTSAALFAMMFESVASGKPLDAKELWRLTKCYDFAYYQMSCDEALKKLGLLWICPSDAPNCLAPNYGPVGESDECSECSHPRPK